MPAPARAEFDPAQRRIPFPNNLLLDPVTRRLALPASCGEVEGSSAAGLRAALNQLDGFGTSQQVIRAGVTEALDPASLEGRVFLMRIAERGAPLSSFEGPVPVRVQPALVTRLADDCVTPIQGHEIIVAPLAPLAQASTYAAVLLDGITTAEGKPLQPSATWGLVRQASPPVQLSPPAEGEMLSSESVLVNTTPFDPANPDDLATLSGLDLLWRAHAPVLGALDAILPALLSDDDIGRSDVLLAWGFNTQTVTDPLDPTRDGSPAALVTAPSAASFDFPPALAGTGAPLSVEAFFATALPGSPCAALGCAAIGAIYSGAPGAPAPSLLTTNFQSGDDCDPETPTVAGPFSDPLAPEAVCEHTLPLIAVVPATRAPATGYPTVIFAHGLGRSKEDLLALAGTLASAGFASISIDAVAHGSRAVQINDDAALGCAGAAPGAPCESVFGPTCAPQCFAPILSANLAGTRDNLRQTVLDQLALTRALGACAEPGACGALRVDADRISYVGQSLGALIGTVSVAMSDLPVGVLHVGGADWLTVLTDTATLGIRCPLIDALIQSGVMAGELWSGGANTAATCVGESWKTDPGFVQFSQAARWVLDPVDGVNFASAYLREDAPNVLLVEVKDDPVVPNTATEAFGTLLGLSRAPAATASAATPDPSPAAAEPGSRWIVYANLPGNAALGFPGNAYGHGSLLAPAPASSTQGEQSGGLGTALLRVDTLTYLLTHP